MPSTSPSPPVDPFEGRSFWGWGREASALEGDALRELGQRAALVLGAPPDRVTPRPALSSIQLPRPRLQPPASLAAVLTDAPRERAGHTYGKAFRDVVRALSGDFRVAPDLVALPRSEAELVAVLSFCDDANAAAMIYGAGSSVVGGVEPPGDRPAVSVDLRRMRALLEVDAVSRAALFEAGVYGPDLEAQLRPHGLTLRHFPQSFEFSSLGGWIATRGGGHFATGPTHIDDFVQALRVVTPAGTVQTRRLPASGAGPQSERLWLGSEGTLGVITQAWMRVLPPPELRGSTTVRFDGMQSAVGAVRAIAQSGLQPSNCRLLDPVEAIISGAGDGRHALLLLAVEAAGYDPQPVLTAALAICKEHGGTWKPDGARVTRRTAGARDGEAGRWREAFLSAPYLRDGSIRLGLIVETFETAVTWDRFEAFDAAVREAALRALQRELGGGVLGCRFTHVYPDGVAPYYTVLGPGRPGAQLAQWDAIKAEISEALVAAGGTITHHHAVGRDHRDAFTRERDPRFYDALRAAKHALDPRGLLNPGVLL